MRTVDGIAAARTPRLLQEKEKAMRVQFRN
jgi:hypothetical protein